MVDEIRTLFITSEVPYYSNGGVSLRNWQNISLMMKYGPVSVFSATNWHPGVKSLPNVFIWRNCNVAEQRSFGEKLKRRLWWLDPLGEPDIYWTYSQEAVKSLEDLMSEFKPNIVVFEQLRTYPYLPVVKRYPCSIIIDNHNTEYQLLKQQDLSANNWLEKIKFNLQISRTQIIEKKFNEEVSQIWVCSEQDSQLIQNFYGSKISSHVIPNGVDVPLYESAFLHQLNKSQKAEKSPLKILFLGQMSYPPNLIAVDLLIEEIYPKVKAIYPDCQLLLVGRSATAKMKEAAKADPGIIVTGRVSDVLPYLSEATLMLVPLLQGGGTRLKILEAFASGTPVISTSKGAEGLKAIDGQHLLIRDSVEEIVKATCSIYSDLLLREKLIKAAYQLVKDQYSRQAIGELVDKAIKQLLEEC